MNEQKKKKNEEKNEEKSQCVQMVLFFGWFEWMCMCVCARFVLFRFILLSSLRLFHQSLFIEE